MGGTRRSLADEGQPRQIGCLVEKHASGLRFRGVVARFDALGDLF